METASSDCGARRWSWGWELPYFVPHSTCLLLRRFVSLMAEASAKRGTGDEPQPPSFARTFSSKERRLGTRQALHYLNAWNGLKKKTNQTNRGKHPSVTGPVESISSPGSRRKCQRNDLFSAGCSSLVRLSPIKAKRGGRPYISSGMKPLKSFYILLKREL